ncbi:MAG TPA: hypothetical protein VJM47_07180, partial [Nitrosospira sp.]|nr:hypothetical protein [Nitrosospira sp.]
TQIVASCRSCLAIDALSSDLLKPQRKNIASTKGCKVDQVHLVAIKSPTICLTATNIPPPPLEVRFLLVSSGGSSMLLEISESAALNRSPLSLLSKSLSRRI